MTGLELFRAVSERANWWLRDVVSASNFANVNNNGNANYNNASNVNGVRPILIPHLMSI
ncbi:MAG: DUF6273 domain-containing protein [Clostridiales bacterium]|nr:DUF6273 domain-containing protein [Clostridiales bacterium]